MLPDKAICRRAGCENVLRRCAKLYCSVKCQREYQHDAYIREWRAGLIDGSRTTGEGPSSHIRRYLMEASGFRCSVCNWSERNPRTGLIPLHVDHIDGNAGNNRPENVRLICPNHHALTETYGNSNRAKVARADERDISAFSRDEALL